MRKIRTAPIEKQYVQIITPEIKDAILSQIILNKDNKEHCELPYEKVEFLNISSKQYDFILDEFTKNGFIKRLGYGEEFDLLPKIYTKYLQGGYVIEFETFKAKLILLDKAIQKPEDREKLKKILSYISIAVTSLEAFHKLYDLLEQEFNNGGSLNNL